MITTGIVHELIHSLEMSEKRYFKVWAEGLPGKKSEKYLRLFDAFLAVHQPEEKKIREKLENAGDASRFFAADKRYLYLRLLECLRQYHCGKSVSLSVKGLLMEVEILFAKGLYEQCRKLATKGIRLAETFELFPLQAELLDWERKALGYTKGLSAAMSKMADHQSILEKQQNLDAYIELHYRSSAIRLQASRARDPKFLAEFQELLKDPLMNSEEAALSVSAKLRFHQVMISYAFVSNDPKLELLHTQKVIDLLSGDPPFKRESPFLYVTFFSRLLQIKSEGDFEAFQQALEAFRSFPEELTYQKKLVSIRVFALSYVTELFTLIREKGREARDEIIPEIREGLRNWEESIEPGTVLGLLYGMSLLFFLKGEYSNALKPVNRILDEFKEDIRPDIIHFARLLQLFIHLELGNMDLLAYRVRTVSNRYGKRKTLYRTEKTVLGFFKQFLKAAGAADRREVFQSLRKELLELHQDSFERHALSYFDFLAWVNEKLGIDQD